MAPKATSPVGVLSAFEWAMDHRNSGRYAELFTDDFQFIAAATDTAGNAYRDRLLTRDEELEIVRHLFTTGTATEPPAKKIALTFGRSIVPQPDSRPGKTWPWHQEVTATCVLRVETPEQVFHINGAVRFFVVRGDSAVIPPDLVDRGFGPDASRWYIERWEDETLSVEGGASVASQLPERSITWAGLKLLYR